MADCPYQKQKSSGRSNLESIILYGGIIYLGYLVLKSWGVIKPNTLSLGWKPLSGQEIQNIRNLTMNTSLH